MNLEVQRFVNISGVDVRVTSRPGYRQSTAKDDRFITGKSVDFVQALSMEHRFTPGEVHGFPPFRYESHW